MDSVTTTDSVMTDESREFSDESSSASSPLVKRQRLYSSETVATIDVYKLSYLSLTYHKWSTAQHLHEVVLILL